MQHPIHFCATQRYTASKPKGPVLQNAKLEEVATPTYKRGFVTPKFWGLVRLHLSLMFSGGMGRTVTSPARLLACFEHPTHLLRVKTQTVDYFGSPEGIQIMSAITPKMGPSVTATGTPAAIPADRLHAVLGAFNAANLASSYIERGNFAAARRKLVLALQAINHLQAEA